MIFINNYVLDLLPCDGVWVTQDAEVQQDTYTHVHALTAIMRLMCRCFWWSYLRGRGKGHTDYRVYREEDFDESQLEQGGMHEL